MGDGGSGDDDGDDDGCCDGNEDGDRGCDSDDGVLDDSLHSFSSSNFQYIQNLCVR